MSESLDRLKRLAHYVISKAGHQAGFGATKLYKVLWFSDARAYTEFNHSITGASYVRQQYGPVPRAGLDIRRKLQDEGSIKETKEGAATRFRSLKEPEISDFTRDELKIVDYWIGHIARDHTANSISEQSHDYAWEIARQGEELPLFAILANRLREPEGRELEWARAQIKQPDLF